MLIDRTHKPWFVASAVIGAAGASAYWALSSAMPHGVTGGSVAGLLFGIVGSAMMVFAALLAVRKRLPTWRVGSAQWWLRGHLWLGTLGFVLILFHSGFGWGGLLENLLWISFGLVVVTGFAGVALQHVIPRLLTTRVPLETMVAQIPFLSQTNLFRADQLIAKQTGPLDIPFEPLKPFAEEVLKQQRVLKRESDFPKELAKVYANVPPVGDVAPRLASAPSAPATKTASVSESSAVVNASHGVDSPTPTKPKSPLELMREKAAAKTAAETIPAGASSPTTSDAATTAANDKPLSPLEQMKAKLAAKNVGDVAPRLASAPSAPAAKPAASAEHSTESNASHGVDSPTPKPQSPLEIMKAKLAAQKGSTSDKPADAPKPLTIDKSDEPTSTAPPSSTAAAIDKPTTPPPVKKPVPVTKPTATATPSVASAPPKQKPIVEIPKAAQDELRDFHLRAVRPFLFDGRSSATGLNDVLSSRRLFGQLKSDLPAELHETLDQLESLCEERRQFNTQLRLHRWLHWWLVLHIPPSIALLVLFVAHVLVSLRVVPFGK